MPRLTRSDIEDALLSGKPIPWRDANNKSASLQLDSAKQRRLLAYLLQSRVREVKNLPNDFTEGLAAAFVAAGDPASGKANAAQTSASGGPWKIQSLKVEGFGGVNAWKGKPLDVSLDCESLLIEGPNGSGKSSFAAAIIWGLTGERPRDQADSPPDEAKPVFGVNDKEVGLWPPVATYPTDVIDLKLGPAVSVEVTFSDPTGKLATAKRSFDGKSTTFAISPDLHLPSILLEAGLLMPARLPQIRLDEGRGRLTDAVQKLTGLDDLIELGTFVQGLCHASRDYLSYKAAELSASKKEFDRQIELARTTLAPISVDVPAFKPADTSDVSGAMATLGKTLNDKASALTKTIAGDLHADLNLADPQTQRHVGLALSAAQQDVSTGLEALPTWKTLQGVSSVLDASTRAALREANALAAKSLEAAVGYRVKEQADNRYRLKAIAARWHAEHQGDGAIDDCPLCARKLKDIPELRDELTELKSAGEAATRRLADNINAILAELEKIVPQPLKRYLSDPLEQTPKAALLTELRAKLVNADRYAKCLVKFGLLAETACTQSSFKELVTSPDKMPPLPEAAPVLQRIARMEAMCAMAEWFESHRGAWEAWWTELAEPKPLAESGSTGAVESLADHLARLNKSIMESEPYRVGAEAMRIAWKEGKSASAIEKELALRGEIVAALSPLKILGNLAEAQARTAISELSGRIGKIHGETYLAESLKFQKAALEKKAGLIVRGKLSDEIRVDATLVANTSWLRGVLWAFIFALREEAVEQLGSDVLPILVLDDPQQTFDSEHRHRWAEQIAKLQKGNPAVQLVLTTHEELFLSFLAIDGVLGRHALICSATPEVGHVVLFEGDALDRQWSLVLKDNSHAAARAYMAAVRVYVEGMLKMMLRGEDTDVSMSVLGGCRDKISRLHQSGHEPWRRNAFRALAAALDKNKDAIKFIEMTHHASGAQLGMTEGTDVQKYWRDVLRPAIERGFRIARDHRALHGGLTALHAFPPRVVLPEGHKKVVRAMQLPLVGTASALTDGRVADGCVELNIAAASKGTIELKDHLVFRLTVSTMEPVARAGDLLVVGEHAPLSAKSLVVALSEERLLARRLEIADNHSDVAVLSANAINPRKIAPPVVAKLSTLTLRKVVGVIYDRASIPVKQDEMEICACEGEASVKAAFSRMQGLVAVGGHSAEPHALDGQYLMIGKPISLDEADKQYAGRPIIAEDSDGSRYFKRYRRNESTIILESLEIGGDFAPVVLATNEASKSYIKTIWPVLGVLFEKPK